MIAMNAEAQAQERLAAAINRLHNKVDRVRLQREQVARSEATPPSQADDWLPLAEAVLDAYWRLPTEQAAPPVVKTGDRFRWVTGSINQSLLAKRVGRDGSWCDAFIYDNRTHTGEARRISLPLPDYWKPDVAG